MIFLIYARTFHYLAWKLYFTLWKVRGEERFEIHIFLDHIYKVVSFSLNIIAFLYRDFVEKLSLNWFSLSAMFCKITKIWKKPKSRKICKETIEAMAVLFFSNEFVNKMWLLSCFLFLFLRFNKVKPFTAWLENFQKFSMRYCIL